MEQFLSHQYIIDCLHAHYGINIITLTFLPLGADNNASVYKAEAQDNPSYFVKLKRGHHHNIGIAILQLLHEAGIEQVIPPIKTIEGSLTQSIGEFTLILYPFIEGEDGFTRALTDEQWLILGKTLRQVHEIDVPLSIKQQIRKELFSSKWREIVRSLYAHIEAKPTGDKVALDLMAFMKKNILTIRRLVDRAEQLAQILQNESPQFVLCHSDIHGGNVFMNNDNTIYIVDWDDPIMAPKERDLMFIGGGVANVWNKSHEEALFYKGYGKTEVNRTILAYYRHERIVEDIAEYGQELLLSLAGGKKRSEMYQHFIAMFEPRGVIDIAFETDDSSNVSLP
ncbi:phosphotransferase enzyme family protein [Legionella genomosp. 1]|uniref:phosphotransferase enzyme family protein n=1 Tax=Legionella genomosp. 1 TaxID=1093625 RepID=UPI0021CB9481|nr:aminoglycoside phosphotransferase family protein [Legionella genomosp. 1]